LIERTREQSDVNLQLGDVVGSLIQKTKEQKQINLQMGDAVGSLIQKTKEQDEINIAELYRLNHVEDAVGSLIDKIRTLSQSISIMESRHNSLVDSLSGSMTGSMRGSIDGAMSDIDSAVSSFLEETAYLSRGSPNYGINSIHQTAESEIPMVFGGSETSSQTSSSSRPSGRSLILGGSSSVDGGNSRTRRIVSVDFGGAENIAPDSEEE
jgi:hypothetical protein